MASSNELPPLVIKRKKVVSGDGHHGGAWKVAYADFVTAMMAFFMLMWLLNATTEQQRKGLADYFSPTVPITRISGGGDGAFGGDSPFSETGSAQNGTGGTDMRPTEGRQNMGTTGTSHSPIEEPQEVLALLEEEVDQTFGDSAVRELVLAHINTRLSDEGLVIEIFSRPGQPLFDPETGEAADWLPPLAEAMTSLFHTVTNDIAIEGHVATQALVRASDTRWQTSTARAHVFRELLETAGLPPRRIVRVTGHADREPAHDDLMAAGNDRLEIILLRADL